MGLDLNAAHFKPFLRKPRASFDIGDRVVMAQHIFVLALAQKRYQFVLLRDHRRPVVQAGVAEDSWETGGGATGMQRLGGAYQGLGRNAADIYACSTDRAVADERHVGAQLSAADRGCEASGASSYYGEVRSGTV